MKSIISFIISFILLIGCQETKKIEIIPDYDEIYLPISKVDTPVEILGDTDKQLDRILEIISETSKPKELGYYFFKAQMFINENGKLEKIRFNKAIPDNFDKGGEINYQIETLFKKLTDYLALQQFSPALKNSKSVKSQYEWDGSFRIDSSGKAEVYLGGLAMTALKNNFNINQKDFAETVEEMPVPLGGMKAIAMNVHYPEIAKRAGIEGRVFVKAFINEEGYVVASEIIKGIGSGCDQAAINAIVNTKFNPGRKNGKPVKVQVTIPIMFKLN